MTIVNPALSLGSAVHDARALKILPVEERLSRDLLADFETEWATNASGKKGGFTSDEEERVAKQARGRAMIGRVIQNPGPISKKTIRPKESENNMPRISIFQKKKILFSAGSLIGWSMLRRTTASGVIDFKTGKNEEDEDSLQLPIYLLLLNELQKRRVSGAAYWYLEKSDTPTEVTLPDADEAREKVLHSCATGERSTRKESV